MEQSKTASLGEMIGNIAHQWRQPLTAISASAGSIELQNQLGILDDEHLSKSMNSIVSATEYLSTTIDTFRDFIKEKKEFKEVILQERIDNTLNIVSASLKSNHIEIINDIDPEPIKIKLIVGELSQVLMNIMNNAKDVMLERKIRKPLIRLDMQREDNRVIITVEDNGGGIPDEVMPKIFDPYFTTKHQSQGTGLGLHMSYKIVSDSLKGKLYAKNTENGAKFFIELPLYMQDK